MTVSAVIEMVSAETIARAAALLKSGALVAFPTETVYGLGADATSDDAVAGIFEAKQRPTFNPLIVHVTDAKAAAEIVDFTVSAQRLADAFWPGPLSLVLPRKASSTVLRAAYRSPPRAQMRQGRSAQPRQRTSRNRWAMPSPSSSMTAPVPSALNPPLSIAAARRPYCCARAA